jgi:CO/xanthine dehydrogenase Mo-binding subunit
MTPDPRSVLRKEDGPLLTGSGRFVADMRLPGMVHAAIVRSPLAHAHVLSVSAAAARHRRGVLAVLTAADLPGALRIPIRQFSVPGMDRFLQSPLATDRVRYVGDPVAVVVAEDRYRAEDAAELVEVDYDPVEVVLEPEAALEPSAPLLFPETGTNLAGALSVEKGAVDEAFLQADLVVEEVIRCQRHGAVPMETRGLVAEPRPDGGITVWGASKIPHINRRILAGLLGWPEERLRLVELHVGGGFGARGEFYPEDYLVPLLANRIGRPVAWIEDRSEHMAATNHSREQVHKIAIAVSAGGRFLALRDTIFSNCGAYVRTHGMTVPGMSAALLHGPYDWPAYRCIVNHVVCNKTPAGTYRAPGRFEANLARERIIDIAAHRLGQDPIELRRRNLIAAAAIPYETRTHTDGHPVVYESGDFPRLLEKALEHFDYDALRRWRGGPAPPGRRRGLGIAYFVEKSGIGVREYARVEIDALGHVVVYSGTASVGQGVETVLAQVCAEQLGTRFEDVTVMHGDTDLVPEGMGAFGSRATMLGGSAVLVASRALRSRLMDAAAEALEVAPEDLEIAGPLLRVKGVVASSVPIECLLGGQETLAEEGRFASDDMSFPYGVHVAAVEVDVETGGVTIEYYGVAYDVGRAVNPALIEGQIQGGVAQGIGGALLEEFAYDPGGQLLSSSFADYLLPTAQDVPNVDVLVTEDAPTPLNPLGVKGAGEAGTAAAGAVIANAVSDALGAEVTELPLSPERVRRLALVGFGS